MSAPLVSVVMPVYNGSRFLRQAIDSVLGQTYAPTEIVVVDDGSTDDSPVILTSYGDKVRAIRQQNAGVSEARNTGVRNARGEFVAFIDQDDWWLPTKVARQVELFAADPTLGLVHTNAGLFDAPSGAFIEGWHYASRSGLLVGRCYDQLLLSNAIFNSSVMVRKAVLDAVGGFDTDIRRNTLQDYDLWLRVAKHSPFAYIAENLIVYRLHPEQGLWKVRDSLVEELRLLERVVGEADLVATPAMRQRLVSLLDQLSIAQLDARDRAGARVSVWRSLKLRWSGRNALLLGLTAFPCSWNERFRAAWTKLRAMAQRRGSTGVPSWTQAGTPQAELEKRV
ncbi:MAG: glycosyltransferase [Gemmataceae bacterium]